VGVFMPAPQSGTPMTYQQNSKQYHRRHQRRRLQRRIRRIRCRDET
jgi:hypothetical protein